MGRRLNLPTPTVINTELIPLTESFYIESDGQLQQWYYENDERYAPNRKVTPMTLTPHISAYDKDNDQTYYPSFYVISWFELAWNETQQDYVETEITNQVDSQSADYVKSGDTLLVKKNVGYSHSVTIICRAQYIDPRDSGITYNVTDSVILSTNRDATILTPELDVECPSSQAFNPLVDNEIVNGNLRYKSEFTMKAKSDFSKVIATDITQYKVDPLGTEEIVPNNETDLVTCAPTLDIRYGDVEQSNQTFMRRQTSGGQASSIAGNMAYLNKIKGNTVAWNQLAINGNFANGTNGWVIESGVTCNISNGTATIVSTQARNGIYQGDNTIVGHFYYFAFTYTAEKVFFARGGGVSETAIPAASNFTRYSELYAAEMNSSRAIFNYIEQTSNTYKIRDIVCYDLTLMFGAGNEPTTAEQFEQWLAQNIGLKSYYPYNEGQLIPVTMSAIKSVGFNIWDEEWELGYYYVNGGSPANSDITIRSKNRIKVLGSKNYYLKCNNNPRRILFYDINDQWISTTDSSNGSGIFTTPSNCSYIRFFISNQSTYNNDICINLSDAARNGTYEAHWEAEQYLPITELTGKVNGQGESLVIFPNGMKKISDTLYDEIKVENGVIKAVKRVGGVDLGSLGWSNSQLSNSLSSFAANVTDMNGQKSSVLTKNAKYSDDLYYSVVQNSKDKCLFTGDIANIYITDSDYSDPTTFKSAMNGVIAYYELATPVEYIINNMPRGQFEWYGISNNAEVLVETLPWYKSGQHTDTLVVDAMFSEEIRVVLRARVSAGADRLYPTKAYRNVTWKIPDVDINTYSENGGAVRGNTESMDFATIVNVKGSVLSDDVKEDNIRFNWKTRKSNSSTETDWGWGQRKTLPASSLRNTIGSSSSLASTMVLPYAYLLGARKLVEDSNVVVTDNGEEVYDRPVS